MDFTCLFDEENNDFVQFTGGEPLTSEDVLTKIGLCTAAREAVSARVANLSRN